MPTKPEAQQPHLIVDAMNVIGTRPDGWWRDRDDAVRRLVGRLQRYAAQEGRDLTVVVDGRPLDDLPEGEHERVYVLYASKPGANAADDRIIDLLRLAPDAAHLEVVTSDRGLARRTRELGAGVRGAGTFLRALDAGERSQV